MPTCKKCRDSGLVTVRPRPADWSNAVMRPCTCPKGAPLLAAVHRWREGFPGLFAKSWTEEVQP